MGIMDTVKSLFKNDQARSVPQLANKMDQPIDRAAISPIFKNDDWVNPITGINTSGDKKRWAQPFNTILDVQTLDTMYQSSVLASSICDIPSYELLRQGFQIVLPDEKNDKSQAEDFKTNLQSFDTIGKFTMGEVFSRVYGGGGIYVGVNDGLNPWDPLDLSKIKSVDYLTLLDRYELVNAGMLDMRVSSANFARPLYYSLATLDPYYAGTRIHYSRIIRFNGIPMSRRREAFFYYWGQSLINRTFEIIQGYESAHEAISSMVQDWNVLLIEMKNLPQITAGGANGGEAMRWFQKKIAVTTEMMSVLHAFVLGDGEKADHLTRNVAGLPEIIDKICDQVVMASKVPRLLLLGKGATQGQNASSEGEIQMFYDYIRSQQLNVMQPKLRKLIEIFMASKSGPFAGNIIPFQIHFNPLWQMDEKSLSSIQLEQSNADNMNIMNGVYTAEEARSRYKNNKFNLNISLDEEINQKVTEANKQKSVSEEKELNPKEPDNAFGGLITQGSFGKDPGTNAMSASVVLPNRKI